MISIFINNTHLCIIIRQPYVLLPFIYHTQKLLIYALTIYLLISCHVHPIRIFTSNGTDHDTIDERIAATSFAIP